MRRLAAFALGLAAVGACGNAYAGPLKTWGAEPPEQTAEPERPPGTEPEPPPPPPSTIGTPVGEPPAPPEASATRPPVGQGGLRYV
ncbi:MAG: hypothetical protein J0I07_31220, partial [Myxococcales bacterium]|nr:hypothetical protein [Myxococcales bacterium]